MQSHMISPRVRAFALTSAVGLLVAGGALPAEARRLSPGPAVELHSAAGLAPDGQSVGVSLLARCPERWTVVDAFVTVSQPQASGAASFPLACTGSFQSFGVTVPSAGAPFELGDAQATASVVIKRGRTEQFGDSDVVRVDPTIFVELAETALLEGGGEAVTIDVTTTCPVGTNGQQSYVNVSQGQASGNGTYVPQCDGQEHTDTVGVQASQGVYQPGSAQALTFAFVEHEGNGFSGVDDGPIQIVVT